ncbi:MAG: VOC family protein [Phormidesmis sp.]
MSTSVVLSNSLYEQAFVALATSEIGRQVNFYSKFLKTAPSPCTATYAEFRLSGLRLAIFTPQADSAQEFSAPGSGAMSLCLEVDDLQGVIAHLTHLGYPPPGDILHSSHGQEIYAYDPDGNRLILHQSPSDT